MERNCCPPTRRGDPPLHPTPTRTGYDAGGTPLAREDFLANFFFNDFFFRDVKNKVTGIDLSIPSHRVIPGLLSSTIEYHVVVVTNLPVFKSAKHKETDTVQFMVNNATKWLMQI